MSFDATRVDLIIRYALLVAGEEDNFLDRQLGPIHLIKYVYLADLFYAQANQGKTFTGVPWKFYKFGPWSLTVNDRIEPALNVLNAYRQSLPSDYGDKNDWVRWSKQDKNLLVEHERMLPACIVMHLRRDIHKYTKDTPCLLDHVYKTTPMLSAAPNEDLDFMQAVDTAITTTMGTPHLRMDALSAKAKKKFAEKMRTLRERHDNSKSANTKIITPVSKPRYDEIYEEGLLWLDSLAGEPLTFGKVTAEFSTDVWKSPTRKGDDVS